MTTERIGYHLGQALGVGWQAAVFSGIFYLAAHWPWAAGVAVAVGIQTLSAWRAYRQKKLYEEIIAEMANNEAAAAGTLQKMWDEQANNVLASMDPDGPAN
jgi:membrane protease YdiL (CAAX protease family)